MLDFSCPVCGRQYHADDEHLGKSIRCTTPKCENIVTIASRDGRYTTSNQQIKTVNRRRSAWIDEVRRSVVVLGGSKINRGVTAAVVAVLLMGVGLEHFHNRYTARFFADALRSWMLL